MELWFTENHTDNGKKRSLKNSAEQNRVKYDTHDIGDFDKDKIDLFGIHRHHAFKIIDQIFTVEHRKKDENHDQKHVF